jgi:hypothetical protein
MACANSSCMAALVCASGNEWMSPMQGITDSSARAVFREPIFERFSVAGHPRLPFASLAENRIVALPRTRQTANQASANIAARPEGASPAGRRAARRGFTGTPGNGLHARAFDYRATPVLKLLVVAATESVRLREAQPPSAPHSVSPAKPRRVGVHQNRRDIRIHRRVRCRFPLHDGDGQNSPSRQAIRREW